MDKPVKKLVMTGIIVLYFALLVILVWGPTIIMALANYRYGDNDYLYARNLYGKLNAVFPSSPYAGHNIGLCLYKLGKYREARAKLEQALIKYSRQTAGRADRVNQDKARGIFHYHLGNAIFKSVPPKGGKPGEAVKAYQEALAQYKKALLANPGDFEAKYNYELTLVRLGQYQPPEEEEPEEQYLNQIYPQEQPFQGKDW